MSKDKFITFKLRQSDLEFLTKEMGWYIQDGRSKEIRQQAKRIVNKFEKLVEKKWYEIGV